MREIILKSLWLKIIFSRNFLALLFFFFALSMPVNSFSLNVTVMPRRTVLSMFTLIQDLQDNPKIALLTENIRNLIFHE